MKRRNQRTHRNLRQALRVESLESRQLMAELTTHFDREARTLTITGSDTADVVSITQNDSYDQITVATRSGNEASRDQQFSSHLLDRVVVQLGAGDDQLQYQTVRSVLRGKAIEVELGTGDDTGKFRWADDGGAALVNLDLTVSGEDGSDAIGIRIGRLGAGNTAEVDVELGEGNDGFAAQILNPTAARSNIRINAFGDGGDDELQYLATGKLGLDARVDLLMHGKGGDDEIDFSNQSPIDGLMSKRLFGGDGNDTLSSSVMDGSGRGRLNLTSRGDAGDDVIVFDVRGNFTSTNAVRAIVNGGTGNDSAYAPARTRVSGIENTLAVNPQVPTLPNEPFAPVLRTSKLQAESRTIEYWTKGRSPDAFAPVVVLVSGAGGSIDSWLPIAEKLNGLGQVIAVNKPSYGRTNAADSIGPDDGVGPGYARAVIDDIRAVVARIAPGRQVVLVGHALGGAYANLFARLHPNEVAGVVFENATRLERVEPEDIAAEFLTPVTRVYSDGMQAEFRSIADSVNATLDAPELPDVPLITLGGTGQILHGDQSHAVIDAIATMVRKVSVSGILADVVAKYGVPGMTANVNMGDRVVSGSAGVRSAASTVVVNVNDRFGVGSVTKAMTATLAGILVERGRVRWESTIAELFPELNGVMQLGYQDVTLQQLLQHRGGMIADEDGSDELGQKIVDYAGPTEQSRQALVPEILKEPLPGQVGEYRYSNAGYAVAGAMLERAANQSYERLMQRYIFNPLGMRSATFAPPVSDPLNPKQPIGHLPDGTPAPGDRSPFDYLSALASPAGSILRMNVGDWSKFIRVHLGQSVHGRLLLRPETLAQLHKAIEIDKPATGVGYAAGWVVLPAETVGLNSSFGTLLTHNGSDGVWLSEVVALPDVDFAIQILANATVDRDGNDLSQTAFVELKQRLLHRFVPRS